MEPKATELNDPSRSPLLDPGQLDGLYADDDKEDRNAMALDAHWDFTDPYRESQW
jgi:hypothetical protein